MENKPKHSSWERVLNVVRRKSPQVDEILPLEPTPETQVLAARITETLAIGGSPQELSPEHKAQWERIKAPFALMYSRYNISKVYHNWRRNPGDADTRQAWQSMLLGVLTSDKELLGKFNAALPLPEPEWLRTEEEAVGERAAPGEAVTSVQPENIDVAEPAVEAAPTSDAVTDQDAAQPGFTELMRELWDDKSFFHIVYALRYSNPSLFDLAAKLADDTKLSGELLEFFEKSRLGKQLVSK